uniref:E3 ubiquitin-protein ligase Topors n=1 Tax=Salarias fasciatus TaxID=181472 RepID=A0A672GS97_SALFA
IMSAVKIALQQSQKSGGKKSSKAVSAEVSPDSKCPICLDIFNNMSYLDLCLHKFCFRCIQEWSKNKAECPLCKQPFNSIYHSIKSDQDFKKYDLRPVDNGSFGTFEGVRFRYRTTLTGVRRHMQGRTSSPPDNGVMFEASLHPPQQRQDRYMVNFRRELYRQGVRVRSVRDGGRLRDTSEELRPFLQARTEHFLHEFISFAKAPFNMEAYDQHAVYDCPAPSSNEGSSSNSSVIAISEDEEDSVELSHPGDPTSSLSHSMWDDETPGPSYSTTAEQSRTERQSVLDSDSDMSSDSDDCVIVGFVKPTAERTPELVQLSSDPEESENEDAKNVPRLPQHIRFTSLSPAASQSSDAAAQSENRESDHHPLLDPRTRRSSSASSVNSPIREPDRTERDRDSAKSKKSRERHASRDRDRRRRKKKKRRSVSGERGLSYRSPDVSNSCTYSTERGHLYPSGREYSKHDSTYRRKGSDHITYQSYSHYSQHRSEGGTRCTQRKSYYYSSHRYSDWRSQSRSRSRDSPGRHRRRSRSRTRSSSRSPSPRSRSHHDKPGGKRKYKTRHLEEPSHADGDAKHKKRSKEKHRKRSKERWRKSSRSVSVELVNDGDACERSRRHKKKKKHKKKSKSHKSARSERRSPTVITIDSDSGSFSPDGLTLTSGTNKESPINPSSQAPVNSTLMN